MSIINQMLQKLEQRHGGRDASLPSGVRAVAAASKARRPMVLGVLLGVLVLAGAYYGWTWWQRHSKPAKSVAVSGKIPGSAPQPVAPVAPPPPPNEKAEEDKKLAEAAQKLLDESIKPAEEPGKSENLPKKIAAKDTKKDTAQGEMVSSEPSGNGAQVKKYSRENAGKIKLSARDTTLQEMPMKSISPQQQGLFYYQKALAWLQQGRVAEARSGLEEALKLDAYLLAARQALAALLVEKRQYHQAELLMQEGLALNAEQYGFAMALARLQVERGDIRAALDTLNKSLPHAADNAGFQAFLAALLQRTEQHKKAIEHYQLALRLAPSGAWQIGLGISLQAENRLAEAQDAFVQAKTSSELTPALSVFVEQRLRMLKKQLQPQPIGEAK